MNKIELKFDNTITRLAGNPYGQRVFNEQVKNFIDYNDINLLVFPKTIENIAISFVQGFSKGILENISIEEFSKKIKIEASEKIKNNFYKYLTY